MISSPFEAGTNSVKKARAQLDDVIEPNPRDPVEKPTFGAYLVKEPPSPH